MLSQTKMSTRHVVSLHMCFTNWTVMNLVIPQSSKAVRATRAKARNKSSESFVEHRTSLLYQQVNEKVPGQRVKHLQNLIHSPMNRWWACDVWGCALVWQLCVFSVKLQGVELSRPFSMPRSHRGCASCFCRIIETKNVRSVFDAWGTDSYAPMCERPQSCHSSPDGRAMVWRPTQCSLWIYSVLSPVPVVG